MNKEQLILLLAGLLIFYIARYFWQWKRYSDQVVKPKIISLVNQVYQGVYAREVKAEHIESLYFRKKADAICDVLFAEPGLIDKAVQEFVYPQYKKYEVRIVATDNDLTLKVCEYPPVGSNEPATMYDVVSVKLKPQSI